MFLRLLLLAWLAGWALSLPARGAEPVRIGVLGFRTEAQSRAHWQALALALKQAIPEREFALEVLPYHELESAVMARQLDFVLTNPSHYLRLSRLGGLSSPLATLAVTEKDRYSTVFGGVVFSRAEQASINSLSQMQGKTVAAAGTESLGGYQMQAYELKKAGINVSQDLKLMITGMPQEKVVEAVLAGRAEVGFVRTGVLEDLVRKGRLDLNRIKVLNRQDVPEFPSLVSTRLYPEWPFAALAHLDEVLARRVAAALFLLDQNTPATQAIGIHGFVVPADYTLVADLLRELRLPPFQAAPVFTLRDIWERYRWSTVGTVLAFGLILLLSSRLYLTRRKLRREHRLVTRQRQALESSEFRWKFAIEGSGDGLWDWNLADGTIFFSLQWKQMLGYAEHEVGQGYDEWERRIHPEDKSGALAVLQAFLDGKTPLYVSEHRIRCKDGAYKWVRDRGSIVSRDAAGRPLRLIGTHADITQHKQAEEKLQLAANVFAHAHEGIMITDAQGIIVDVNDAFSQVTGYARDEVIGRNPRLLASGRQNKEFYSAMWRDLRQQGHWRGEVWNRRKNGEVYAQLQDISAVRDGQGKVWHYVSLFFDITPLKEQQQQLEQLAHFDLLTGLPNRLLLADRLQQGMAQVLRRGQLLAVVFLDLDDFKPVNDLHGHDAGDQLLIAVASRMKQALREGDTLARIGGDEFVAVLLDLGDAQASAPLLERLLDAATLPLQYGDVVLQVSATLGVTFYPQEQDVAVEELLRQADLTMYQAKRNGKNCYRFFAEE
ncbi:MAG: diguanylate cyclase [Rhodoferax sp.]|uniref:diguanylate cyclase domain-containing protein n=1 Tax=Rhodoferax sp. TaxID=50421 RepID=UPI00260C0A7D|nr:diguanylate cyclase [Rhodoferax sp.]MDD5335688.1 diguanylate cyclase [Rhodoferax sp.]